MNKRLHSLAFWALFIAIVMAIRYLSMLFFDVMWTSILLTSVITTTLIILSKKGMLGWFGDQFLSKFAALHNHKRRILVYFVSVVLISSSLVLITLIHSGNNQYEDLKYAVMTHLKNYGLDSGPATFSQNMSVYFEPGSLQGIIATFSVALAITNDLSNGMTLISIYMALVGEIELFFILMITRSLLKKNIFPVMSKSS